MDQELESPEVTLPESAETESAAVDPAEPSNEPGSMLEAIEAGLSDNADEPAVADGADAEKKPDPAVEAKPGEHVEDDLAIPEGLSKKAQERFTTLVSRVKEREAQAHEANEQIGQFREMIKSTGTTPQEFSQAIDYMRMVKHGDLEGALRIMDEQRRMISLALGKQLPGADALEQFPDLRQRVDAYQMDEQTALELARTRHIQQQDQQHRQQQQETQQRGEQLQQTRQQAVSQIDQMGQQWSKTDPDFRAKEDIILKQLPMIAQNFHPNQWAQQVRILYDTISSVPMQRTAARAPAPLRSSGQTAGARAPGSMLEALDLGLGYGGD